MRQTTKGHFMHKRILLLITVLTLAACGATPRDIPVIPQPAAGQY
ncbi:MAG: hypothetical protein ACEPO0_02795 [Yoonia sp.]